ncbi:MAG: transposase [Planctomycetes bacterium]|nr:transposase [Planctomycetota bacterium]
MKGAKRKHTAEFKSRIAIEALRERYSPSDIAGTFDLHVSLIHAWRQLLKKNMASVFRDGSQDPKVTADIRRIEQRIEELRAEQEWMRRTAANCLDLHSRRDIVDPENDEISVVRQATLLGLHRSGVYYQKAKELKKDSREEHEPESEPDHPRTLSAEPEENLVTDTTTKLFPENRE